MGVTGIDGQRSSTAAAPDRTGANQLGRVDFMSILLTQMRYQDPLSPMNDRDFTAQIAQFSMLEQITEQTRWAQISYGLGLVGQNVSYHNDQGGLESGVVRSLRMMDGRPILSVNEAEIAIDQITEARP